MNAIPAIAILYDLLAPLAFVWCLMTERWGWALLIGVGYAVLTFAAVWVSA